VLFKFGYLTASRHSEVISVALRSTGGSATAEARSEAKEETKAKPGQRRPAASEVECTA